MPIAESATLPPIPDGARYADARRRVSGVKGRVSPQSYMKEAKVALSDAVFNWTLEHGGPFPFDDAASYVSWSSFEVTAIVWVVRA